MMTMNLRIGVALLAVFLLARGEGSVQERREFRARLERMGPAAVVDEAMRSSDSAIRTYALARLYESDSQKAIAYLDKALDDESPDVRKLAVSLLGPHLNEARRARIQAMASQDKDQHVRWAASASLWPLHRKNVLLKDDKSWDYLVKKVGEFEFPASGWRTCADADSNGHWRGFGAADFDDSAWQGVKGSQIFTLKKGIRWYRVHFTPAAPSRFHAFEVVLPAVKGKCFVWLNGIYLGQRMEEAEGEVRLNATSEVIPGKDNVLSIRIEASGAGGLTKMARGEWMD